MKDKSFGSANGALPTFRMMVKPGTSNSNPKHEICKKLGWRVWIDSTLIPLYSLITATYSTRIKNNRTTQCEATNCIFTFKFSHKTIWIMLTHHMHLLAAQLLPIKVPISLRHINFLETISTWNPSLVLVDIKIMGIWINCIHAFNW